MNQNDRHIKKLLDHWIKGSLNRKTEADLEGIAKEDAFTGEALKGLRKHADHDHEAAMMRLRKKVGAKKDKTRPLSSMLRVAASICLLVVAGFAFWFVQQQTSSADLAHQTQQQENNIAVEKTNQPGEEVAKETIEIGENSSVAADAEVMESALEVELKDEPQDDFIANARRADESLARAKEQADADVYVYNTEPQIADEAKKEMGGGFNTELSEELLAEDADIVEVPVTEPSVVLPDVKLQASPPSPTTSQEVSMGYDTPKDLLITNIGTPEAKVGDRLVKGIVTDRSGEPLIGASILELGTNNGTVTDIDGFFQFAIDAEQTHIQVSYTGFDTQEYNLENDAEEIMVVMEEGFALEESVVTALGAKRNQSYETTEELAVARARPVLNTRDYNNYVNEQAALITSKGKVRLTFDVQADGSVTNIQVKRSNNEALNDYAIQIISEGPKWEVVSGVAPVAASYTIRFR